MILLLCVYSLDIKLKIMEEKRFKDDNGNHHRIDIRGNHFINGRCVNPKTTDKKIEGEDGIFRDPKIGDTYKDLLK